MQNRFIETVEELRKYAPAAVGDIHLWPSDNHNHQKLVDGHWIDLTTGLVTDEEGRVIEGHPATDLSLGEKSKKAAKQRELEEIKQKEQDKADDETLKEYHKTERNKRAEEARKYAENARFMHGYNKYLEGMTGIQQNKDSNGTGSKESSGAGSKAGGRESSGGAGQGVSKASSKANGDFQRGIAKGTASTGESLLDVFSNDTEYSKSQEAETNKRIVQWFKDNEAIFSPQDVEKIGEKLPSELMGGESILYRMRTGEGEGQKILKAMNLANQTFGKPENSNNFQQQFDRVFIHNTLFPDTGYTIEGLMYDSKNRELRVLLSQDFVEGEPTDTMEKKAIMLHWLKDNGFEPVRGKPMRFRKGNIEIDDLHESNVLIDSQGQPRFIDPVIEINKDRN